MWPCITGLSRLADNPSLLLVQVKKNGLSERISQEERKRQEVGTAVPLGPFVAFRHANSKKFRKELQTVDDSHVSRNPFHESSV